MRVQLGRKNLQRFGLGLVSLLVLMVLTPSVVLAGTNPDDPTSPSLHGTASTHACGDKPPVQVGIDLGCKGEGNPILDMMFALIRFLSYGIGLVIVGSMVYAGIQYTGSRGDPNANALAVKRIQSNVTALLIFIFAFALVNYVVPGALLK